MNNCEFHSNDEFWFNDPISLISGINIFQFFPTNNMSIEQKLNAIVRFSIYFAVIMYLTEQDICWVYFALLVMCFTILYYRNYTHTYVSSNDGEEGCVLPTENNPYRNRLIFDDPEPTEECEEFDTNLEQLENDLGDQFKDLDNVYNRNNQFRQFYTTPETDAISNQAEYANWLYGDVGKEKHLSFGNVKNKLNRHNKI